MVNLTICFHANPASDYPARWTSVVFSREEYRELEHSRVNTLMLNGVADLYHLRKPLPPPDRLWIHRFRDGLFESMRDLIVVHDCFREARQLGFSRFHLNSRNPAAPPGAAHISKSCHSLRELEHISGYEYVTLSPIFDSISKSGYHSAFSLDNLRGRLPEGKVIALGGVDARNLFQLYRAGFAGGAMLGAISDNPAPAEIAYYSVRLLLLRAFPLLLITDSEDVEGTVAQARAAYEGGCRWVQVRMKDADSDSRLRAADSIVETCPGMLVCIDDDCLAVSRGLAHGVHLGKNDLPTPDARLFLDANPYIGNAHILGRTANTFADVKEIMAEGGEAVDYLGIGPLRFTTTKKNLAPALDTQGYRDIIRQMRGAGIHTPVLAIGGITPGDIPELMKAGVDGVAVSGAINRASDPVAATRRFIDALRSSPKP